jgi:hypothetical protein
MGFSPPSRYWLRGRFQVAAKIDWNVISDGHRAETSCGRHKIFHEEDYQLQNEFIVANK